MTGHAQVYSPSSSLDVSLVAEVTEIVEKRDCVSRADDPNTCCLAVKLARWQIDQQHADVYAAIPSEHKAGGY